MARRTLHHLDERICKRVIYYGANKGIESVSTKRIALDLHISEPTIYVHFKSKDDLLKSCYNQIANNLEAVLETSLYSKYRGKKAELEKDVTKIYEGLFKDIASHKEEVIFGFNYRRYSYTSVWPEVGKSFIAFIGSFDKKLADTINEELSGENNFLLLAPFEIFTYEIAKGKIRLTAGNVAYMQNVLGSTFSEASLSKLHSK